MRFLANENFPLGSVRELREAGHDVVAVIENAPGAKDTEVLSRAARKGRMVLTFDRDYGELIYRRRLPRPTGILYLRFDPRTPREPSQYVQRLLEAQDIVLEGKFTIVERARIR